MVRTTHRPRVLIALAATLLAGCGKPALGMYETWFVEMECTAPPHPNVVLREWDASTFSLTVGGGEDVECNSGALDGWHIEWCGVYECAYVDRVPGDFVCTPRSVGDGEVTAYGRATRRRLELTLEGVYAPEGESGGYECAVEYKGKVMREDLVDVGGVPYAMG